MSRPASDSAGKKNVSGAESGNDSNFEIIITPEPLTEEEKAAVAMPRNDPVERKIFDLLESLVRMSRKRVDPSEMMDMLRTQMGGAYVTFQQDRFMLQSLGMHHLDAFLYSLVPTYCRFVEHNSFGAHPRVGCLEEASPYITSTFLHLQVERFYLFCVNTRGTLKVKLLMNHGIEDRALLSLRRLLIEVLRYEPAGVIVAHNHPNGTMRPSQADIECTAQIMRTLSVLGVPLLDHVIAVGRNAISIRENGFIPERIWMAQDPKNHLLRDWLRPLSEKKPPKRKVLTPEKKRETMERQQRIKNNKRKRNMEMARSLYNRYSKQAESAYQDYQKLLRKVEYNDLESTKLHQQRRIDRYIQIYTRKYERWLAYNEYQKQLKKQKKKKPAKD